MAVREEACEARLSAVKRGAIGGALTAVKRLQADASPRAHGWSVLLRSAIALLVPEPTPLRLEDAQKVVHADLLQRICGIGEQRAFACFDAPALDRWRALRPKVHDQASALSVSVSEVRRKLLAGVGVDDRELGELESHASAIGQAELLVEIAVQRTLSWILSGDPIRALAAGRRASRIARTEGFLGREYEANLVLAQLRRRSDRSYAASRILSALELVCPEPWRGWLALELFFVGRPASAARAIQKGATGPAGELAQTLLASFRAISDGDRSGANALQALSGAPTPLSRLEVADFLCLVDAAVPPETAVAGDYRRGQSTLAPAAVAGWLVPKAQSTKGSEVWVAWDPDTGVRRVLSIALPTLQLGDWIDRLDVSSDRAMASIAALLLAGPQGLAVDVLYRDVFGGLYEKSMHDGLLRTTLYRARKLLDGVATLERDEGRVHLRPVAPLAVPDPRCAPSDESRLLRLLAEEGPLTAKHAAELLSRSLRKAQASLKALVDDGCCEAQRRGRQIVYVLEDTTFSQPTLLRLAPG